MYKTDVNKKARDSQIKIYKSLRHVLTQKPLEHVTIQDIKEDCGISRSTFYRNFNNMVDVLDFMLNDFYIRYLKQRVGKDDQILYFFQYWAKHRDLVRIISENNEIVIKNCLKKNTKTRVDDLYIQDIIISIITSLLSRWSESKKETPEQMKEIVVNLINKTYLEQLFN